VTQQALDQQSCIRILSTFTGYTPHSTKPFDKTRKHNQSIISFFQLFHFLHSHPNPNGLNLSAIYFFFLVGEQEAGVDSQSVRRATELVRLLNTGRCPEDEQRSHNSTQLNYNR
jgi:hypothetical protein